MRLLHLCVLVAFTSSLAGGASYADQMPQPTPETKAIDTMVFNTLRDVINQGAARYNGDQDYAGCWHIYEGALITIRPFLAHRPKLQTMITESLQAAEGKGEVWRRCFVLREALDTIRKETNPNPKAATEPAKVAGNPSLWEKLGKDKGVNQVIDDLFATAGADPEVDFFRGKIKPDADQMQTLKRLVLEYVSAVSGGPYPYTGRSMFAAHKGMGITAKQFDKFAGHLKNALEKNGVKPEDAAVVLEAVGKTRKDIVEEKVVVEPKDTLWTRLGGEKGVTEIVTELLETAGKDKDLNFWELTPLPSEIEALKKKIVAQVSEATGGPIKYTGKSMKEAHKNMKITNAKFDAFAGHLAAALKKSGVKEADQKAVMEWAGKFRSDIVKDDGPKIGGPELGDKKPDAILGSVSGKVSYKGKPLPGGLISFTPEKGDTINAVIKADGTYTADKIANGKYGVVVSTDESVKLPVKYLDVKKSGLTCEVTKDKQVVDFDLKD